MEFAQRSNVLSMNLWGRKWSPHPIPPPSWLLPGFLIFILKDTEQSADGAGLHIIYPTALTMSERMLNYLLMQELNQGISLFL